MSDIDYIYRYISPVQSMELKIPSKSSGWPETDKPTIKFNEIPPNKKTKKQKK
jgi:hypothetical protein